MARRGATFFSSTDAISFVSVRVCDGGGGGSGGLRSVAAGFSSSPFDLAASLLDSIKALYMSALEESFFSTAPRFLLVWYVLSVILLEITLGGGGGGGDFTSDMCRCELFNFL